jgi:hypothetical protein
MIVTMATKMMMMTMTMAVTDVPSPGRVGRAGGMPNGRDAEAPGGGMDGSFHRGPMEESIPFDDQPISGKLRRDRGLVVDGCGPAGRGDAYREVGLQAVVDGDDVT